MRMRFAMAMLGAGAMLLSGCQEKSRSPQVQGPGTPGGPQEDTGHKAVPDAIQVSVVFKYKEGGKYREAFKRGAEAAVKEVESERGPVELSYHVPAEPTAAKQAEILDQRRRLGAHLILLEAADPYGVAPMVLKARNNEIQVLTFEADCDADQSHRLFWVSPTPTVATGRLLADLAARAIGAEGEVAVLSVSPKDAQQKRLGKTVREQIAEAYPKMSVAATEFGGDDPSVVRAKTKQILAEHPNAKAIVVLSRYSLPTVAATVEEAKAQDRVAVLGLGTPAAAREFVKRGTVRYLLTWNPEDLGYFSVRLARMIMNRSISIGSQFQVGRLGNAVMDYDEIPMAEPLVVTAETVDAYDY